MIPRSPGLLCAAGLLAADMKAEFTRAMPMPGPVDQTTGDTIVADLMARALAWLEAEDVPDQST